MKVAVIQFPGSNCDQDAYYALRDEIGIEAEYVWHDTCSLEGFQGVFIPGGFSYGDYLRCGAMASRAPIMGEIHRFAREGKLVIGACNGFQILCEAGILPGALVQNVHEKFICKPVFVQAINRTSPWTRGVEKVLKIPIAHGEGRYVIDRENLQRLQDEDLIAFRYVTESGETNEISNVNGSENSIAGVLNRQGNVLGLMPHPERASRALLGGADGAHILNAFKLVASCL
jgi:phosphoribosylformylglycinamidine synthase I